MLSFIKRGTHLHKLYQKNFILSTNYTLTNRISIWTYFRQNAIKFVKNHAFCQNNSITWHLKCFLTKNVQQNNAHIDFGDQYFARCVVRQINGAPEQDRPVRISRRIRIPSGYQENLTKSG